MKRGGDERGGEGGQGRGGEGRGKERGGRRGEGGEGRGEEAFLVMWPRRLSALNPPLVIKNPIVFTIFSTLLINWKLKILNIKPLH